MATTIPLLQDDDPAVAASVSIESRLVFTVLLEMLSDSPLPSSSVAFRLMIRWPTIRSMIEKVWHMILIY